MLLVCLLCLATVNETAEAQERKRRACRRVEKSARDAISSPHLLSWSLDMFYMDSVLYNKSRIMIAKAALRAAIARLLAVA